MSSDNLMKWQKKIRRIRVITISIYMLLSLSYLYFSWQVLLVVLAEQCIFLAIAIATGYVIVTFLFILLLLMPKIITKQKYNKRLARIPSKMESMKFISKRRNRDKVGYYFFKCNGYGRSREMFLDDSNMERSMTKVALGIEHIFGVEQVRDNIIFNAKPIKRKIFSFFKR